MLAVDHTAIGSEQASATTLRLGNFQELDRIVPAERRDPLVKLTASATLKGEHVVSVRLTYRRSAAGAKPVSCNALLGGIRSKSLEREVRSNDVCDILGLKLGGIHTQPIFVSVVLAIGLKPVGTLVLQESAP